LSVLWVELGLASVGSGQLVLAPEAQKLILEWRRAYEAKDYPKAIELGRELVELTGGLAVHQYNLACVYSLNGDKAEAVECLGKSADKGFREAALAETDPDLENIRAEPGYAEALARIKRNHAEQVTRIANLAAKAKPMVILPPGYRASRPAPLVVALHPYGTSPDWIVSYWKETAKAIGAILVAPQAVRMNSLATGYRWGDVDEADAIVKLAMTDVLETYAIDRQRVVLTGFSEGASVAHALGRRHPDLYTGVIPIAGRYTPPRESASRSRQGDGEIQIPRYYIMVGSADNLVNNNRQAARDYETAGLEVSLEVFDGLGHEFPPNHEAELRKALEYVWKR
jgi:predicted esterase